MDCPFLERKDTGWFSTDYICRAACRKIGNENDKSMVDRVCDGHFYDCPIYKKERG